MYRERLTISDFHPGTFGIGVAQRTARYARAMSVAEDNTSSTTSLTFQDNNFSTREGERSDMSYSTEHPVSLAIDASIRAVYYQLRLPLLSFLHSFSHLNLHFYGALEKKARPLVPPD
jgi:hypothetical protein